MSNQSTNGESIAPTRSNLAIKGSSRLVAEFFEYCINSILYQRGIYPPEDFTTVRKYDLNMLVTVDSEVKAYTKKIMGQLHRWLVRGKINRLVIAITSKDSGETLERWEFEVDILLHDDNTDHGGKPQSEIQREIQSIIRQLTASVTFLPELEGRCTFNVLVYADADADVPPEWADGDPRLVTDCEKVQLRSFSTDAHTINTSVAYKLGDSVN